MTKEKKQTVVLGALGAMLLAVGAFQFVGGGGSSEELPYGDEDLEPTTEVVASNSDAAVSPEEDALNQRILSLLDTTMTSRDPFKPKVPVETVDPLLASGNTASPPAQSAPKTPRPSKMPGGFDTSWPEIPPLEPPTLNGGMGGPMGLEPRESENPGYKLAGVIVGKKKMAVIEDGSGRQRLVPLGQSIDGKAEVVGIGKDSVRIKQDGQIKELGLSEE